MKSDEGVANEASVSQRGNDRTVRRKEAVEKNECYLVSRLWKSCSVITYVDCT